MIPAPERVYSTVQQVELIFRQEHGRVLAALISQLGDFALAEDALQDALLKALETWPQQGIPQNPGAWITTVAKRCAIDHLRRDSTFLKNQLALASMVEPEDDVWEEDDMPIPDERLKLMFTCCHPALALEAQVALTLRTLGGLTTPEIARAFLVPTVTMAQRLVRAQRKIKDAGIPYIIPPAEKLPERLDALLTVLYLIFNEGYCATGGDDLIRHELCEEAIRLCRMLVSLLPSDAASYEAHGLLALMLLHDSRRNARTDQHGTLILLEAQDHTQWDQAQIQEGIQLLENVLPKGALGPYQLQAAISAVHAESDPLAGTDWPQIVALYDLLTQMVDSPVVKVNQAVAIGMAQGIPQGLRRLYPLRESLDYYYPYHAALADLLRRDHQWEAAADAYRRAIDLCQNTQQKGYLETALANLTHH